MEITKEVFIAAAAIIAGVFSLVGLIVSKELKVSELRQHWINTLRDDLSKYLASIKTLYKLAEAKLDSVNPPIDEFEETMCAEFRKDNKKEYLELNETNNRILLRLNPDENDHIKLINKINENTDLFYDKKCKRNQIDDGSKIIKEILEQSQLIIKREWEKVKKGEFIFRVLKYILFALFVLLVIFGGLAVYNLIFSYFVT